MKRNVFFCIVMACLFMACAKTTKEPTLDVEALGDRFGGQNPVGLMGYQVSEKEDSVRYIVSGFCTAFIVEGGYVLTNAHCVQSGKHNSAELVPANRLHLFFRNPGNSSQVHANIVKITDYQRDLTHDWAILEPEDRTTLEQTFGHVSLADGQFTFQELKSDDGLVEHIGFDPPSSWNSVAVLKKYKAPLFSFEALRDEKTKKGEVWRYEDVDEDFYSRELVKHPWEMVLSHCNVVEGNSGSPLFKGNTVVGLLFGKGIDTSTVGFGFFLPGFSERLSPYVPSLKPSPVIASTPPG